MPTPLLKTKLYIPPPRPNLVMRPRLQQQVSDGLHGKLTLVSAPPGFGKTTLLSDWIHQNTPVVKPANTNGDSSLKFAWLSLDEQDNDAMRFWTYVITALDNVQPNLGADALSLLAETQSPPLKDTLTTLINAAADVSGKMVLVLDDYHLIESNTIHDTLSFFIDHLPAQIHLMMTSRSDPPLPLTRLRVRGQLTELRDSDLRFTPAEAAIFLNQVIDVTLSPENITALETRTEGWIAGLQLAALSMQGRSDVQTFVKAFTGSHRYVIDYLAEEVLNLQSESVRRFLLHTSVLDRLCGPLCDAILNQENQPTDGSTSQQLLEQLDQANLFLIPLDDNRRWYRYHHLFADFLREYLHQTSSPHIITTLHDRARNWYAHNDYPTEAISHALAANKIDAAVTLIEQEIIRVLTKGEVNIVQNWLNALPKDLLLSRPRPSVWRKVGHWLL